MENLLQGIPYVVVRVDDILVSGETEQSHIQNLKEVMRRLSEAGLQLNKRKCTFMVKEVVYLGHCISSEGVRPIKDKVRPITEAPISQDVSQLKSYLGMINYYHRYLPNLSTELAPLHDLLKKGQKWKWGPAQDKAFIRSKEMLKSADLLIHYDSSKELLLFCDASPYGVGTVLAHRMEDGSDRPIAYASRTLAPAEKNYSQIDKEGLSVIFGVKKFHQYLFGNTFTIYTDHKPLLGLFGEERAIPQMAADRIRRWALTLATYSYKLEYKPGKYHGNVDGLSRLPLPDQPKVVPKSGSVIMLLEHMNETPVNVVAIRNWTRRDPTLSKVLSYVQNGWPTTCTEESIKPFFRRRDELSVEESCILWGNRVIIPPQGRKSVLKDLHIAHPGICRIKSLARSYVWWPSMDSELEETVRQCTECQVNRKTPAQAPLHPWDYPCRPWSRIHIDYAGPYMGKMFLIIVDSYSKWIDSHVMNTSTSQATIEMLRITFSTHGIPDIIVSDNGTNFTSDEFERFIQVNSIRHIRVSPHHPSSNGLAERAVQTFKEGIEKMQGGNC